jgi:Tol biopolymer transport system component
VDLRRGVSSRLTFGDGLRSFPVWSPDGTRVAYSANGKSTPFGKIVQKLASGSGDEQLISEINEGAIFPTDWSRDGKQLLIGKTAPSGDNFDLLTVAADGRSAPAALVQTPPPIREINGHFSPDNQWFAYQSNESGRNEVFIQALPPSGGKWQVSTAGGTAPMWRGDGKEIIYQGSDDTLYAVSVRAAGAGFEIGLPVKLFQRRMSHGAYERNSWTMTRDGQRFLLIVPLETAGSRNIQVVQNWADGLKKP